MSFQKKPGFTERKFFEKVLKTKSCWLWEGCKSPFGHGQVRIDKKPYRAHRVIWEWTRGSIPKGFCVLHRCDIPACVNPDHLFLGTKKDNSRDMAAKGRSTKGKVFLKGEQIGVSKLTEKKVRLMRKLYARNKMTQYQLAGLFDISQGTVGFVLRGETWKGV